MKELPYPRIVLDFFFLASVLCAPLSVLSACAFLGLLLYPRYIEIVIVFLCADLLYMGGAFLVDVRPATVFPMTFFAVIAFTLAGILRKKFRERY